jgi:hypothetical protein
MNTCDKSSDPDAVAPVSAEIFRFVTFRLPRQVAGDPPSASIDTALTNARLPPRCARSSPRGLGPVLRQAGQRLWLLLNALSLLGSPGSAARVIALPEDDYRRLAARQTDSRPARLRHRSAPAP